MAITADAIKQLRETSGAGIMEVKKALVETGGDTEKALKVLRERGLAKAAKLATREAKEGLICSYIHHSGRVGVLVEVNCVTDFVARTEEFGALCRDIAMHIAAANPQWIRKEDVSQEALQREIEVYKTQARNEGKPEKILDKIAEGKLNKFYTDNCLIEQPFIRDEEKTVGGMISEYAAKTGENIVVSRFVRFALGEGAPGAEEAQA